MNPVWEGDCRSEDYPPRARRRDERLMLRRSHAFLSQDCVNDVERLMFKPAFLYPSQDWP